ncbi:MAG: hypothetical protein U9R73_00720 [Pseudomonadota bacterium]|nr:hypothetical protein [Pseudomonadota bacterium]
MAKKPTTKAAAGHNSDLSDEDKAQIAKLTTEIVAQEKQRAALNAKINSNRKQIKAYGIDLEAWAASKKRQAMDPDVRAEFDRSLTITAEALGVPIQGSLFGEDDDPDNKIPGGVDD